MAPAPAFPPASPDPSFGSGAVFCLSPWPCLTSHALLAFEATHTGERTFLLTLNDLWIRGSCLEVVVSISGQCVAVIFASVFARLHFSLVSLSGFAVPCCCDSSYCSVVRRGRAIPPLHLCSCCKPGFLLLLLCLLPSPGTGLHRAGVLCLHGASGGG